MPDTDSSALSEAAEAAKQIKAWEKRRDQRIRQARAEGASLRAIASEVGLHHSTVKVIGEKE